MIRLQDCYHYYLLIPKHRGNCDDSVKHRCLKNVEVLIFSKIQKDVYNIFTFKSCVLYLNKTWKTIFDKNNHANCLLKKNQNKTKQNKKTKNKKQNKKQETKNKKTKQETRNKKQKKVIRVYVWLKCTKSKW